MEKLKKNLLTEKVNIFKECGFAVIEKYNEAVKKGKKGLVLTLSNEHQESWEFADKITSLIAECYDLCYDCTELSDSMVIYVTDNEEELEAWRTSMANILEKEVA